jgi:hypothetical protein
MQAEVTIKCLGCKQVLEKFLIRSTHLPAALDLKIQIKGVLERHQKDCSNRYTEGVKP